MFSHLKIPENGYFLKIFQNLNGAKTCFAKKTWFFPKKNSKNQFSKKKNTCQLYLMIVLPNPAAGGPCGGAPQHS